MKTIANIFSALQVVCFGFSTIQKKEKAIYILQGLAPAFIAVALFIRGGYTAAAMALLTTVANFLALKGRFNNAVFSGMIGFMLLITFITYRQPIDIVSLLAAIEGIGVKKFYKTAHWIHLGMSVNCVMYTITDGYFGIIPSAIADSIFAVSSFVSFVRLTRQEKKTFAEAAL